MVIAIIDGDTIRLVISKGQKEHLKSKYCIDLKHLTLKIENFSKVNGNIKTIEFKPLAGGSKYGKSTKRIDSLYNKMHLQLNHYFHSATKAAVDYCIKNDISKVVIGDIKDIRENANLGKANNQKFHALPYGKIFIT